MGTGGWVSEGSGRVGGQGPGILTTVGGGGREYCVKGPLMGGPQCCLSI